MATKINKTRISHVCEARPVNTQLILMQTCCGLEGLARSNPSRFIFDIVCQLHASATGHKDRREGGRLEVVRADGNKGTWKSGGGWG